MYGLMTIFVSSAAAIFAVHDALIRIDDVFVNEFLVPSALRRRWNAIFWICPKLSGQPAAGILVRLAAAGHVHKFITLLFLVINQLFRP